MSATSIIGGLVGLGASLFGNKSKVKMPDWVSTDTTKEQAGAIAGNQQNFEAASRLSSNVNQFNNDELEKFLRRAIPGYDDIVNNSSALIQSGLKGELPADVAAAINQKGASKAIAGGYGGGGMGRNLVARDLDLLLVPWADRHVPEAGGVVGRIADVCGLKVQAGSPSDKPHGRRAWSLLLPGFTEVRWVDVSAFQPSPDQ